MEVQQMGVREFYCSPHEKHETGVMAMKTARALGMKESSEREIGILKRMDHPLGWSPAVAY
jgi:hypothetical protein